MSFLAHWQLPLCGCRYGGALPWHCDKPNTFLDIRASSNSAGGANTEMELQLYQGFVACGLQAPQLRVEVPLGNSPEFRSLLPDLLAAVMPTIIAKGLTIDHLGDLNTLRDRLDHELDKENSFASFVALIGVFGHK